MYSVQCQHLKLQQMSLLTKQHDNKNKSQTYTTTLAQSTSSVKPYSLVVTGQIGKSFDMTQYDHVLVKMNIWLRCAGTAKFASMVNVDKRLYWLYYCFGNTTEVQQFH